MIRGISLFVRSWSWNRAGAILVAMLLVTDAMDSTARNFTPWPDRPWLAFTRTTIDWAIAIWLSTWVGILADRTDKEADRDRTF